MRRIVIASFLGLAVTWLAGCPKGNQDYKVGRRAEVTGDYDTAVVEFDKALKTDPLNAEFKLSDIRARFEAGQFHVEQGEKALNQGQLELALSEFQKAEAMDPSSAVAIQDAQKTLQLIAKARAAEQPKPISTAAPEDEGLMSAPPELKPLSREPLNVRWSNTDARMIFRTIGQLAGISVIFDPSFVPKTITVDLPNVTLEQALDAVSLECDAFWQPVTSNIILVATDNVQNRNKLQDEEVQTFYLRNTTTPQELTEVMTGLRQLLDITRIQPVSSDNAIVIRATPAKLMLASKIIAGLDTPKAEVVLQVDVLEARLDHERTLGIQPGQSASLAFTPRSSVQPSSSTSSSSSSTGTTSTPQITLNNLAHLSSADYSLTLPGATLNALLTDDTTRIIQDPTVRITDGATAKLTIGDRIPIATGSFQAGLGVSGSTGISPLVNTQFQYQDVGVIMSVTPRVHPNGDVSMKLSIEVSSVTGETNIGGIQQPIISKRSIEHDIRLSDGQTSILGGLITRSQTKSLNGWPGLANIPFLRYFFASQDIQTQDDDVLIALTPHVVRMPGITADDLRSIAAGTDTNVRVYTQDEDGLPMAVASEAQNPGSSTAPPASGGQTGTANAAPGSGTALEFQPSTISLKTGDTMTIGLAVNNAHDLYSIPIMLQYNPAVIQIEDIRNGGFLSGGTQEIAIVQQENAQQGQAVVSATRRPNTPGISGTGTLLGIVIKAIAPGTSQLQVLQVNARDSQQKPIPMTTGMATIQVQ
ncbi:MAG TPA: cohesin domain-containing protein [Candidatus Acidoferrales bacterium]|nr:cohesin domain-containing protein [Candidatus Acidoferrales bacterium]